jgi:hypothetical protein
MDILSLHSKERKQLVEKIKKEYPPETRIELVEMNDPYTKLTQGEQGTVRMIDDAGTIHVSWDSGSSLGIVYGLDKIKKIK